MSNTRKDDASPAFTLTIADQRSLIVEAVQAAMKQAAPTPLLVDTKGAAELLNLPVSWVACAARRGEIPIVRAGHHVRFRVSDLESFISRNQKKESPTAA